jgi:hypothetical protein
VSLVLTSGSLNILARPGPLQACNGIALLFTVFISNIKIVSVTSVGFYLSVNPYRYFQHTKHYVIVMIKNICESTCGSYARCLCTAGKSTLCGVASCIVNSAKTCDELASVVDGALLNPCRMKCYSFPLCRYFFLLWRCDPTRVMVSSFLRFLDHTQRRTTVCMTPPDE